MKVSVWILQSTTKRSMSEQNPKNHTDLMWQTHMQTLMKRKKNMEIAQTIDDALYQYYTVENDPVPKWRQNKRS